MRSRNGVVALAVCFAVGGIVLAFVVWGRPQEKKRSSSAPIPRKSARPYHEDGESGSRSVLGQGRVDSADIPSNGVEFVDLSKTITDMLPVVLSAQDGALDGRVAKALGLTKEQAVALSSAGRRLFDRAKKLQADLVDSDMFVLDVPVEIEAVGSSDLLGLVQEFSKSYPEGISPEVGEFLNLMVGQQIRKEFGTNLLVTLKKGPAGSARSFSRTPVELRGYRFYVERKGAEDAGWIPSYDPLPLPGTRFDFLRVSVAFRQMLRDEEIDQKDTVENK